MTACPPDVGTVPQGCARYLERRDDVRRETERLDGVTGYASAAGRKDLALAEREEALELRLSPVAAQLARAQAAGGDEQAREALERADQLDAALVDEVRRIRATPRKPPNPLPPEHPGPLIAVREALASHRERGLPFDRAWEATADRLSADKRVTGRWRSALLATRAAWKAAYLRADDPATTAVSALAGSSAEDWRETPNTSVAA